MSRQDKATTDRHAKTLRELVKLPENKTCADCKRNDPRWASWNLGVFICIRCSGIHRSMGTHISKVKSVDLDVWTPEQMSSIQKWGNARANLYWEAHLKPGHIPPDHKMDSFIRSKYESRRWAMEGPPPSDPSVLENGSAVTPDAPSQTVSAPQPLPQPASSGTTQPRTSAPAISPPSRPQHSLLSTVPRSPPPKAAAAPTQPTPTPAAPQNDLFSLDFHSNPSANSQPQAPPAPKKDVKSDILSLFSAPPAPQANPVSATPFGNSAAGGGFGDWGNPTPNAFAVSGGPGAFFASQPQQPVQQSAPTSMIGQTGTGMWGVQSGWNANPVPVVPAQSNVWGAPPIAATQPQSQNQLFGAQNPWGSTSTSTSTSTAADPMDLFSTPFAGSGSATTKKKDDAFGDLWGSFK